MSAHSEAAEGLWLCPCSEWVRSQPVPGKVIGFRCERCKTSYTLFPNGEIMYEQQISNVTGCGM